MIINALGLEYVSAVSPSQFSLSVLQPRGREHLDWLVLRKK